MSQKITPQSRIFGRGSQLQKGAPEAGGSDNDSSISLPITTQEKRRMISRVAYYAARRRGFTGGDPVNDWLQAERKVEADLAKQSAKDLTKSDVQAPIQRKGKAGQ
jgi:hypothetical protein